MVFYQSNSFNTSHNNHIQDLIFVSKKYVNVKSEIIQHCISNPSALHNSHFINALFDFDDSTCTLSPVVLNKKKNMIIQMWIRLQSPLFLTTSDIHILCT